MVRAATTMNDVTTGNHRASLIHQAFWLEYLTFAWMIVEAAVGIGAGLATGSLVLTAFGILVPLRHPA